MRWAAALLALVPVGAFAQAWSVFDDPYWGTVVAVPPGFTLKAPPDAFAGTNWHRGAGDDAASLAVWAADVNLLGGWEAYASELRTHLEETGATILSEAAGDGWIATSALLPDGSIRHERIERGIKCERLAHGMALSYRPGAAPGMGAVLDRISESFGEGPQPRCP